MRAIELKTAKFEDGGDLNYRDYLLNIVKTKSEGMLLDEVAQVIRVIGAVRQANETLYLEDADHAYLVQRIDRVSWTVADQVVLDFVHDIKEATQMDASQLAKKDEVALAPAGT